MYKQKARSDSENTGCKPGKGHWEGTCLPQGRKCGSILSFLHHKSKEISADIQISEDGIEEVGFNDRKDSSGVNILRLLYFFVSLQLNAELHLENQSQVTMILLIRLSQFLLTMRESPWQLLYISFSKNQAHLYLICKTKWLTLASALLSIKRHYHN